ncbi:hypothetical protein E3A20_08870 [Planctomyces bekefii]|uniref:PorV/PorQ family protein n=1 Tax=Planctomyces bekefii TaxID=1653850 RepID=A0A5C6M7K7_9PLAN|nr:hypothetical protein E3A20_08870 [Planctomyces bekefii]
MARQAAKRTQTWHGAKSFLALALSLSSAPSSAQDGGDQTPINEVLSAHSVIEESYFTNPRTTAMGGASITVADDLDAAFANPAGIGGLNLNRKDAPYLRKLYFPWLGLGANAKSAKLYREFKDQGGGSDSTIGRAIVDAHSGDAQYARANFALGMVFGRTLLVPFADSQLAAVAQGSGTDAIDVRYRGTSGVGYGFSAQDPAGRISIGYFGFAASRKETQGVFSYNEFTDSSARKAAIKESSINYEGVGQNVGIIWRIAETARPTFGLNLKNAGDTVYTSSSEEHEDLIETQDLNLGFSVSPKLGSNSSFNFVVQADHLLDYEFPTKKKYHIGLELCLAGFGSYSTMSLRSGYNDDGPSAGLSLNVGLVALESSVYSVDIGVDNEKMVEQRYMTTLMVNVAEF